MAGVGIAPPNGTVRPADTLLSGRRRERAQGQPCANVVVERDVRSVAKCLSIAVDEALPQAPAVSFDAAAVVEPCLALGHEFDRARRIPFL